MEHINWNDYALRALDEDHASEDVTTRMLGDVGQNVAEGRFVAQQDVVVAGLPLIDAIFQQLDRRAVCDVHVANGDLARDGTVIATVRAPAAVLLGGERVALNYLQRLSGIATLTRRAVDQVGPSPTVITDTRKTTPGLRQLEKYAVRIGGGVNHRGSLRDAVLVKDNHWEIIERSGRSLRDVIRQAPDGLRVQVEVESEAQLREALDAGVKFFLFDNQTPDVVRQWLEIAGPDVIVEASGGITIDKVSAYAAVGVHRISIGALTHSPPAAEIRLDLVFM